MNSLSFINLIKTFFFALIRFAFNGWIGWLGMILILMRIIGVIHWSWWITALPLEYGAIYCLYMTIDGARYRAGLKNVGAYAQSTSPVLLDENFQIQVIIKDGPKYIGETIDNLCNKKSRLKFNQALLDASLKHYDLFELSTLASRKRNPFETIEKWRESGLQLPDKGTPEFGKLR